MPWLKFHQYIYIAVRPKIIPQGRAKDCELMDVMTAAEVRNLVLGYNNLGLCHTFSNSNA